jgi:hypothetical protein
MLVYRTRNDALNRCSNDLVGTLGQVHEVCGHVALSHTRAIHLPMSSDILLPLAARQPGHNEHNGCGGFHPLGSLWGWMLSRTKPGAAALACALLPVMVTRVLQVLRM